MYSFPMEQITSLPDLRTCRRDNFSDLQLVGQSSYPNCSRDAYVGLLDERVLRGAHLYSRVEEGTLVHYGWMIRQESGVEPQCNARVLLPRNSVSLIDFYTHE